VPVSRYLVQFRELLLGNRRINELLLSLRFRVGSLI